MLESVISLLTRAVEDEAYTDMPQSAGKPASIAPADASKTEQGSRLSVSPQRKSTGFQTKLIH